MRPFMLINRRTIAQLGAKPSPASIGAASGNRAAAGVGMSHGGPILNRRQLLQRTATGFGMLGLSHLLASQASAAPAPSSVLHSPSSPLPHFTPKAKRVIFLFLN